MDKKEKRIFLYEPYGEGGYSLILYFHKKPTIKEEWDMIGVDVPTKECNEWHFWRTIQTIEEGNDSIQHDLSETEIQEIKNYIRKNNYLVPNFFEIRMIEKEYGLYFDDVLMDTFTLDDEDFSTMIKSFGVFDFDEQNEDLKHDWLYLIGGRDNPKITIVNLITLEKLE